jgi:hypothetical protein
MDTKQIISAIEKDIDAKFASSSLKDLGYAQAMWTLLAVNEDHYLSRLHRLSDEDMHIYVDSRMNSLTHPLRACAEDYDQFCSLFPM